MENIRCEIIKPERFLPCSSYSFLERLLSSWNEQGDCCVSPPLSNASPSWRILLFPLSNSLFSPLFHCLRLPQQAILPAALSPVSSLAPLPTRSIPSNLAAPISLIPQVVRRRKIIKYLHSKWGLQLYIFKFLNPI